MKWTRTANDNPTATTAALIVLIMQPCLAGSREEGRRGCEACMVLILSVMSLLFTQKEETFCTLRDIPPKVW